MRTSATWAKTAAFVVVAVCIACLLWGLRHCNLMTPLEEQRTRLRELLVNVGGCYYLERRYSDGSLQTRIEYRENVDGQFVPDGIEVRWFPSGVKESEWIRVDGEIVSGKQWDREGRLLTASEAAENYERLCQQHGDRCRETITHRE